MADAPRVLRVVRISGTYQQQLTRLCELVDRFVRRNAHREIVIVYDIDDTVVHVPAGTNTTRPIERVAECFRAHVRTHPTYFCTARPLLPGNEDATRTMLQRHGLLGFRRLRMRVYGSKVAPFKWATCRKILENHAPSARVVRVGDMLWDTVPFPYPQAVAHLDAWHDGHYIELSNGIGILLPTRELLAARSDKQRDDVVPVARLDHLDGARRHRKEPAAARRVQHRP